MKINLAKPGKVENIISIWIVKMLLPILTVLLLLQANIYLKRQIDIQDREVAAVPYFYITTDKLENTYWMEKEKGYMSNENFAMKNDIDIFYKGYSFSMHYIYYSKDGKRYATVDGEKQKFTPCFDLDSQRLINIVRKKFENIGYDVSIEGTDYYVLQYTDYQNEFKELKFSRNSDGTFQYIDIEKEGFNGSRLIGGGLKILKFDEGISEEKIYEKLATELINSFSTVYQEGLHNN